jgi:hypothetical protein
VPSPLSVTFRSLSMLLRTSVMVRLFATLVQETVPWWVSVK